jgi:hypothetical protein
MTYRFASMSGVEQEITPELISQVAQALGVSLQSARQAIEEKKQAGAQGWDIVSTWINPIVVATSTQTKKPIPTWVWVGGGAATLAILALMLVKR